MILQFLRHNISTRPKISAFIAGILCSIAHAPLFFTPGLIGFSVLVYIICQAKSYREAITRNIAFGYGYFGYGLYWISIGISVYIDDFWWLIPICLLGMPLIFCILTSFAAAVAWKYKENIHYVLIYTIAWIFIEWLTTWIFTGLPWMLVGYSAGFSDIISQMASLCGVIGISFILFNLSSTFYYIWQPDVSLKKHDIYYMICILGLISLFGVVRLENNPTKFLDVKVRIVQPSIAQSDKWDRDIFWQNLGLHKKASLVNTGVKPDIILWSEAAVTAPIQLPIIRKYLNDVAKISGALLITGSVSESGGKHYTSASAIDPFGNMIFEYHKRHLVPFGEYVPWKEFLPIKKLTAGFEDYAAGEGDKVFTIEVRKTKLKIRPLICYESVFGSEVKAEDADLLLNLTNNAWYGDSAGPYQHFYIGKFRAIESGIPMVTVANNGISGVVDSMGRIISKTKIDDIITLDSLIPQKMQKGTIYNSTIGYFFIIFIIFGAITLRSFCIKFI